MIDYTLEQLRRICPVTPRQVKPAAIISKKGMRFVISAYELAGIGRLSVIRMRAMLGLMKMDTLVLTPLERDMPLLSYDLIQAMGNDTLLLELYDTQLTPVDYPAMDAVKAQYAHLPDNDLGKKWYDHLKLPPTLSKKGKKLADPYRPLCHQWLDAYLAQLADAPVCDRTAKQAKVKEYVDGLFENGGPSTDQFKKLIGEAEARALFETYIFSAAD